MIDTEAREQLMTTIRECAEKIGHAPSIRELQKESDISLRKIRRAFGSYGAALDACGLRGRGPGYVMSTSALFVEWATIVRRLGKVPSINEWEAQARCSIRPLRLRYRSWHHIPQGMLEHARREGLEGEWKDVMDVVMAHMQQRPVIDGTYRAAACTPLMPRLLANQPFYGTPLIPWALTYAPTNEIGVVYLFGTVARELGYAVTRMQTEFPDGEAMRQLDESRWQRVRIEFEFESRNFQAHYHKVEDCDLIVCWKHNWAECPLEVLELKTVVGQGWSEKQKL
jgi:Homing endonuclease associated repeat